MSSARVLLMLASAAFAARLDAQSLLVGFRAGQSTAEQHWRIPFQNGKTGRRPSSVTSGFSGTLDLKSWLAVESDLLYVEKGSRVGFGPTDEMRIGYVELPVLLRLATPVPALGLQLFVQGGPAPSFETSCSGSPMLIPDARAPFDSALGGQVVLTRRCDARRETKRDFGWVTGGGVLLRRPEYQITASLRRTQGVRDLFPDDSHQQRFNNTSAFLVSVTARAR